MAVFNQDVRVGRPKAHESLLTEMRNDAGFPTMRDALLFAASVGLWFGRQADFESSESGEPIRYDTLVGRKFADALVSMIAAHEIADPEILDDDRLGERVKVFSRYANGGLEYIQDQINTRSQPVDLVVQQLVAEVLAAGTNVTPAPLDDEIESLLG